MSATASLSPTALKHFIEAIVTFLMHFHWYIKNRIPPGDVWRMLSGTMTALIMQVDFDTTNLKITDFPNDERFWRPLMFYA